MSEREKVMRHLECNVLTWKTSPDVASPPDIPESL